MMTKINFFTLLCILCLCSLLRVDAQSIQVIGQPDTTNFPELTVTIQMNTNDKPLKEDFQILDEGEEVTFEIDKKSNESSNADGRIVFFLVDASSYTNGTPLKGIKRAVSDVIDDALDENDLVNIGYYGEPGKAGKAMTLLANEFVPQPNSSRLKSSLNTRVESAMNDSITTINSYRAMIEAIEEFERVTYDGQKMLILLSGAIDYKQATYTPDDVIREAERQNVAIYTFNHLRINQQNLQRVSIYERISKRTGGESYNVNGTSNMTNGLRETFASRSQQQDEAIQQYDLTFRTASPADGNNYQFTINYQQEPPLNIGYYTPIYSEDYSNAPPEGILQKYGIYILIAMGLLLGLGYYFYNERQIRLQEELEEEEALRAQLEEQDRKKEGQSESYIQELKEKNIRLQEQLKLKEQELAKKIDEAPTVIPPEKYDLKNTSISGGGGAPFLQISAGAFQENFRLNKPTITIGRGTNNDIIIPEQTVSSKHATITIEKGSFFINDLGSTNGTFVNGSRISSKLLKSGDIIKLGAAHCRFEI